MLWNSSTGCFRQQKYAQVQKAVRFMEENQFQCYETERYLLWAAQLHTYKDRRWMGKNPCQFPCCYPSILLWPWSGRGWWTRGTSGLIKCISPYVFFLSMLVGWITVCLLPFVFCINHKLHPEDKWPCSSYHFWDWGQGRRLRRAPWDICPTQVSVQRGDGGCWAAQCLHSPAYRARLCWKQWAQSSSIGHRSRMPCSPKPRTVLLTSKMSAPCSATPLMAAEEPRAPSVKFVRMSSRSLAEVSLIEAYTFRPLHLSFLFIGSTFLFFCFTQLWCLACIIHGRK